MISYSCCMLYEPAGLSLHFLFIYTRSFVAPDFLKTSRHTSQQKGGQRRSFSKRFLIQAPVIIMKIIDSHLHFCPGYPHFDEIAIEAGHIVRDELGQYGYEEESGIREEVFDDE